MTPMVSDHKPIASMFRVPFKQIDPVQQKSVTQSILDYLKNLKENFVPKMVLSTEEVDFGGVSYGDNKTITLDIENAGDGLLEFDITKLSSSSPGDLHKQTVKWLSIEPLRGVVKAGEKAGIHFKL